MIDPKSCCVWVVEFTKGVIEGHRKKIYMTAIECEAIDVAQIVLGHHPNTEFTVYNVDAGILTIPEKMASGDILYQPSNIRVNQHGQYGGVTSFDDEPGFDDVGSQIIMFKPPSLMEES